MVTRDDVYRIYGAEPPVDPDVLILEIGRTYDLEKLEGNARDLAVIKTANKILTQPYFSGKAVWEEQNLGHSYNLGKSFYEGEKEENLSKALDIPVEMRGAFFKWLEKSDKSPWDILEVSNERGALKVRDERGIDFDMPFSIGVQTLKMSGFTKDNFTDFFEFRADTTESKVIVDEKGRLVYTPLDMQEAAWVEVVKGQYDSNDESVEPHKRGMGYCSVVNVLPGFGKEVVKTFEGIGADELASKKAWKQAEILGNMSQKCNDMKELAEILAMTGSVLC